MFNQAIILAGYNAYILALTGQLPAVFGDDSLVEVIEVKEQYIVVSNTLAMAYIPRQFIQLI